MNVLLFFIGILVSISSMFAQSRLMQSPDISEGGKITFSYDGDIWLCSKAFGTAWRLTSHPGNETSPKFSPDGKNIIFSADYNGSGNLYLISLSEDNKLVAGLPKRLTYNSGCQAVTWTPDGKNVIFRTNLENTFRPITRLYSTDLNGSMPEPLPVPRGVLCSFSPDGKKMIYCPRGREEYYWKRYKGGQFQEIWLYDFETKKYSKLTDYVGKNAYPMWVGSQMYFVSDRDESGISNLFFYDFASKKVEQVTFYKDFDVQMSSSDGKKIIYINAGYIYVFDPVTKKSEKVEVNCITDDWKLANRNINPSDYIQTMRITNDGNYACFEARGDVYSVPSSTISRFKTKNLTNTNDTRERFPQISPDGKWVAFFSEKTGEYELYIKSIEDENAQWVRLTNDMAKTVYKLIWSPDSKKILFGNKDFTLFYIDIEDKKLIAIDSSRQLKNDEFYWEVSDYVWSPDSKWIAYSFVQYNRNNQVFLYSLESAKIEPITTGFYDCMNPTFDANGEFLYYLAYQDFGVRMDIFEDNHVINHPVEIMAVQLKAGLPPPFIDTDTSDNKNNEFRIDIDNLRSRIFKVPVKSGNYFYLKAGAGKLTFSSVDGYEGGEYRGVFKPSPGERWDLHIFDIKSKKEKILNEKINNWELSPNGKHIIVKKSNDYYISGLGELYSSLSLRDKVNLNNMSYLVEYKKEWEQIFNDAWRWYRDFFYDPGFHGKDWKALGEKFRAFLPNLRSRSDLNWLLSQLVGELCVSHTYVGGGDMGPQQRFGDNLYLACLGADFKADATGYYKFAQIFGPTEFNPNIKGPLTRPDVNIKEGDYLFAIDGKEIKYPDNIYKYLQIPIGAKIRLTIASNPSGKDTRTYEIEPVFSEYSLRYERWISDNIKKIEELSNGEIGYMHLTAMGDYNVGQFDKYWRAYRYRKGMIIDVRGNGGGWTEYFMIDKLERKMVAFNCVKDMNHFRYPGSVTNGKLVALANEYTGSDGEAFLEHFKARKLGTVIGVPTWGGLVGILNGQPTIDGGNIEQSNNAFFGKEGKWWVENHGADPDLLIDNDPESAMAGRDKQLETAIELLMKQIKEEPFVFPDKPAYPKK
ncbi:MAG: protease [Ignavibacteria bacterium]|nr:protease [Ignavibacteria bacterium]